jgi:pilus assembly protein CpaB
MRPKSLAVLLLALGCGLVASIGIMQLMAAKNTGTSAVAGDTQAVFVAMADVGMGDLLSSQMLRLEQWPKDKIPPGAISRIEDIEGRRARTRLYAGEPILENKLLGKGASQQGATALIPKGYRVVPVKVDLVSGGGSLILPGDRVDVMVHLVRDTNREVPETVTRTILQDIKVFAVNDVLDMEKEKDGGKSIAAKTISMLVTPEQAAKVMLASQMGTIQLVMRSPEDDQATANVQATPSQLFGDSGKSNREKEEPPELPAPKPVETTPAVAVVAPPRDTWTMRILKPGTVDEVSFEAAETKIGSGPSLVQWKATTTTNLSAAAPPVKDDPKTVGLPPAVQEPVPPSLPKSDLPRKPKVGG